MPAENVGVGFRAVDDADDYNDYDIFRLLLTFDENEMRQIISFTIFAFVIILNIGIDVYLYPIV